MKSVYLVALAICLSCSCKVLADNGLSDKKACKKELKLRLRELDGFKDTSTFKSYGFGGGGPYNGWLKSVQAAAETCKPASVRLAIGFTALASLGLDYVFKSDPSLVRNDRNDVLDALAN